AELDELRGLRDESRRMIAALQARYAGETGVPSLKIRHNNVLGYYIEVGPNHAAKLVAPFIHRQTLASAVRFTTRELGAPASRIPGTVEKALALEWRMLEELVAEVAARAADIQRAAAALAALDVAAALAERAVEGRYARPVVEDGTRFEVTGGRHPVVEAA